MTTQKSIVLSYSGVYQIKCLVTGNMYVGSTTNLHKRWVDHKNRLAHGRHDNYKLQQEFNSYHDLDLFEFDVLEYCDNLLDMEQYYIDLLKPYYNLCPNAGSSLGTTHNEVTKKKISQNHADFKGKNHPRYGKPGLSGKDNPFYGKTHTPEIKEKLSSAMKGKHLSEATKQKLSERFSGVNNPMYGKKHSEETRLKMQNLHNK